MAYALVGSIGTAATTANMGTTAAAPAFAQATTAGNLLIAWAVCYSPSTAITTAGSGWLIAVHNDLGASGGGACAIFYKPNCGAGETAPTFSGGAATGFAGLGEFSGGARSSPIDRIGTKDGATSPQVCVNAATDVAAGELFVAVAISGSTKAATTTTSETFNNGATPTSNLNNDATSSANHYRFAWGITTGNTAADQTSHADTGMNLVGIDVATASFLLFTASLFSQPCNIGNSPGMLMEGLKDSARSWRRRASGIVVPRLWTPDPAPATI